MITYNKSQYRCIEYAFSESYLASVSVHNECVWRPAAKCPLFRLSNNGVADYVLKYQIFYAKQLFISVYNKQANLHMQKGIYLLHEEIYLVT